MNNPWERITAEEYEKHMKLINQHDLLNRIFKEQINENNVSEICILVCVAQHVVTFGSLHTK